MPAGVRTSAARQHGQGARRHRRADRADSAALRRRPARSDRRRMIGEPHRERTAPGPTQCHDITLYPAIGLAGGACEGYGLLLDISDPGQSRGASARLRTRTSRTGIRPRSTTTAPRCCSPTSGAVAAARSAARRIPRNGAPTRSSRSRTGRLEFKSYYKLPAAQTAQENCVAHNGSLIPIPGRDVMVQAWYQGGISVFDWTDPAHPKEIAFFDRGPVDSTRIGRRRHRGRCTGTTA